MKKPHKHAEVLIALAEGKAVQYGYNEKWFVDVDGFAISPDPLTNPELLWRVKPEPKPDVVEDVFVWKSPMDGYPMMVRHDIPNLRLIFDGESGLFKDAEVLE